MNTKQIAIILLFALVIAAWFTFDLGAYLQFDAVKARVD